MTRFDLRHWLGGRGLSSFKTEAEVAAHFTSANLMPILGNQYTFEEMEEARALALRLWREQVSPSMEDGLQRLHRKADWDSLLPPRVGDDLWLLGFVERRLSVVGNRYEIVEYRITEAGLAFLGKKSLK